MKILFSMAITLAFVGITASVFADTEMTLDEFSSILEKDPETVSYTHLTLPTICSL